MRKCRKNTVSAWSQVISVNVVESLVETWPKHFSTGSTNEKDNHGVAHYDMAHSMDCIDGEFAIDKSGELVVIL